MRLLVNYARGSLLRDADNDEVFMYWTDDERGYEPVFHEKSADDKRHVIVIHPKNEKSDLSSWIEEIVNENGFERMGLLYHSPEKQPSIESSMRSSLPDVEYAFVDNYSSNASDRKDYDAFYVPLAEACRDHDGFAEAFDALWERYTSDEDLEVKLDLLHKLLTEEGANDVNLDEEVPAAYREQVKALQEDYSHEKLETLRDRMLDAP